MFGDMFLTKIANKGSSLRESSRVATDLQNMENLETSGNLKNCQNLMENSGKFEFLKKKPGKLMENETMWYDRQQKSIPSNFPLWSCSGKN